jgi:hypothetical protein
MQQTFAEMLYSCIPQDIAIHKQFFYSLTHLQERRELHTATICETTIAQATQRKKKEKSATAIILASWDCSTSLPAASFEFQFLPHLLHRTSS